MNLLALIPSIIGLFSQIFPNASQAEHDKFQLALQTLLSEASIEQEQIKVNEVQAASPNIFTSGPRPFVMWVCGVAFAWQAIIMPVSCWVATLCHQPLIVSQLQALHFDPSLNQLLFGLLGIGGVSRTFEKYKGVQNNH